jgi:hypothetical protein
VDALIFIIILIVVVGASVAVWKGLHGPGKGMMLKPGPGNQLVDQAQPPHLPGQPGFQVRPDAGFVIVSRTDGQPMPPSPPIDVTKFATGKKGLNDVTVTQNLTAICRLTGTRVTDCTCGRCTAIKSKRKA